MRTIILFVVLLLLPSLATAMKPPNEYGFNECELIAKDLQKEYGGSLVWIVPLQRNGAFDLDHDGHMLNRITIGGTKYYIDYSYQRIFKTEKEVKDWYHSHLMPLDDSDSVVYDLAESRPPFAMNWKW